MSDEKFSINDAIEKYQEIAAGFQYGWIDEDRAKKDIEALNKKCLENEVTFKADFKSLELFPRDDESYDDEPGSSYYDDYGSY